ncbi:MAG: PAS domain S-box protein, partial [Deltaproteobacteria bacterium]|nr:PAS domain S-box protein [Deltaproteobacteria bacterium]
MAKKTTYEELNQRVKELEKEAELGNQAEEKFRESEEKYRSLVETMSEGLVLYDENNLSTYANDSFCQMLGYSKDEIMGRPAIDFLDDDNRKTLEEQIPKRRDGKREPYELDWTRKDGQKISTIVSPSPIFDVEARYAGAFAVVTDISEHKDIQKKLGESVSLLSATLDATADGILVVDREGKIVSFNKRFVEMWRIPDAILETRESDQALAFVLDQLRNPESFLKKVKALYSRPDETSFDVLDFKDGRVFERYSRPQQIAGKSVGRVWSFRNMTDRNQAEEALRESEEKYSKLFHSNPQWLHISTLEDGHYVEVNEATKEITGYERDELIGRTSKELGLWADYEERS